MNVIFFSNINMILTPITLILNALSTYSYKVHGQSMTEFLNGFRDWGPLAKIALLFGKRESHLEKELSL